jgi:hypothetical protein
MSINDISKFENRAKNEKKFENSNKYQKLQKFRKNSKSFGKIFEILKYKNFENSKIFEKFQKSRKFLKILEIKFFEFKFVLPTKAADNPSLYPDGMHIFLL